MSRVETIYIGHDGQQVVDSATTIKQIETARQYEWALYTENGGPFGLGGYYDHETGKGMMDGIIADRKVRVDQRIAMADRPPIVVLTVVDNVVIRLEYYRGHDALKLTYDDRAKSLIGKEMPPWMERDPQAYDPIEFLRSIGFPMGGPDVRISPN